MWGAATPRSGVPPTRREIREAERAARPGRMLSRRQGARNARRPTPRLIALGAIGVLAVAAPVVGLDGSDHSAHGHTVTSPVTAETSILDALTSAPDLSSPARDSLSADPAALRRGEALQASRSAERGALDGAPVEGADGTLAVFAPAAELVMPLAQGSYRLTSPYGGRPDPFTGAPAVHTGVDLAAPMDSPIYAVADGVVEHVGRGKDGRSSMLIVVRHEIDGETFYSWYNHMYASGLYVEDGQEVRAGDVIAGVGSNGRSTGPHLHFEIHTDDDLTTTDPLSWLEDRGAVDVSELS